MEPVFTTSQRGQPAMTFTARILRRAAIAAGVLTILPVLPVADASAGRLGTPEAAFTDAVFPAPLAHDDVTGIACGGLLRSAPQA
jgi:hypothetical protein